MNLHPHIELAELIAYCQLCHEYAGKCGRVRVDTLTLRRVWQVAKIETPETAFLGIKFLEK